MDTNQPTQETRLHFLDYWRVIKTRWPIVLTVFLLTMITVTIVTYLQPKTYMASVRIKVEQERPTVSVFEQANYPTYDPFFLQTQNEIIQSQKILYPVIDRLKLMQRWADRKEGLPVASLDLAVQRLKRQIAVRRFRDTSLIEIAVYDTSPQLAAEIANQTAESFEQERLEEKRRLTLRGLEKLREEMGRQQERMRQAQAKMEQLRKELNVPVIGETTLNLQTLQQLENQLTQARVEVVTRETQLKELNGLTPQQLRNAITTIISDPNVQSLLQALSDTELRLEVLKQDYGPDHPNVRTAFASRDKLQQQLDARLDGIMKGFEVSYQMATARVEELRKQFDNVKNASLIMESERFLPFRNAQREAELETRLYETLKGRLQQVSIDLEVPRSPVEVMDRAEPPLGPVSPNMWLNLMLGTVFGLILGVGMSFFIEFLDTSVKAMEDVERYLGLPVIGVVSHNSGMLTRGNASAGEIEAYRMLRTNIEFSKGNEHINSFAILSAAAGEGKSFTVANLACVFAQNGARVLVVDSDLRRPTMHDMFGVTHETGLADYLTGSKSPGDIIQASNTKNVWIISAGSKGIAHSALPMLTSQRMNDLVQILKQSYDIVLYDTPPVLVVSDAVIVAREVGAAILVIQHRRYPRNMARRAKQVVESAGARVLGVVMNNINVRQDDSYYYYHGYYDYTRRPESKTVPAPRAAGELRQAGQDSLDIAKKY
jgi:capsular exopolysaccharide synthesis family protein